MSDFLKKHRVLFVAIFIIVVLLFVALNYLNSFGSVDVNFGDTVNGVKVSVYKVDGENHEANPKNIPEGSKIVKEISSDTTLRLKKGNYIIKAEEIKDHEGFAEEFEINAEKIKIDFDPDYTSEKLGQLKSQNEPQILQQIKEQVPRFNDLFYKIDSGKLYKHGDWYAAIIRPNLSDLELSSDYHDAFRVVVKKSGNSWKVVTVPPELVLSKYKYPEIPVEILYDINKLN